MTFDMNKDKNNSDIILASAADESAYLATDANPFLPIVSNSSLTSYE